MSKMNFEEFKQAVVDNVKDFLPGKYEDSEIGIKQVVKNNDTVLDAVTIQDPDSNVSPVIYLNNFYEDYEKGKDLDQVIGDIADVYVENAVSQQMDSSVVTDFEKAKGNIIPRLVNAEENQELLSERPHKIMDDLAVTYHIELVNNGNASMSVAVTNAILDVYGITSEELHDTAIANLESQMPTSFQGMTEVVKEAALHDMIEVLDGDIEEAKRVVDGMYPPQEDIMFVLSNEQKLNGAAVALNEKAMEMVSEKIGGDFFVLPSSIHELLIVPKAAGVELSELENMVQEVNATQVAPEEKLSDHVYEYDANEKELFRADRAEEHYQKVEQKHEKDKVSEKSEKTHERVSVKDKIPSMKEKSEKINKDHDKSEKTKEVALA